LTTVPAIAKQDLGSNIEKGKWHDQILHYAKFTSAFTDAERPDRMIQGNNE
jgi:hypothetical protein